MNYRLAYAIGFHPWEDLAEHPPFAGKLLELVAREEDGREPPYDPALGPDCLMQRSSRLATCSRPPEEPSSVSTC